MPALKLVTPPAVEPVLLADAKAQARVSANFTDDDALLNAYITAARGYAEIYQRRSLIKTRWKYSLDNFPYFDSVYTANQAYPPTGAYGPGRNASTLWNHTQQILLPQAPTIGVVSLQYYDANGVQQTLVASSTPAGIDGDYVVDLDNEPARIFPAYGKYWPGALYTPNAVQITFDAGYGIDGSTVPAETKLAIQMLVAHYYENREILIAGGQIQVPAGVDALLWTHRNLNFTLTA